MNRVSALLDGSVPAIAASFGDSETRGEIDRAFADGLDIAELRVDMFENLESHHVQARIRDFTTRPTILTVRHADEGGLWTGSEPDRLDVYVDHHASVDAVDVEVESAIAADVVGALADTPTSTIGSKHILDGDWEVAEVDAVIDRSQELGFGYTKIAVIARTDEEVSQLASLLLSRSDAKLILFGIGPAGKASRVFFPTLGSRLTYCSLHQAPAPGQLTFANTFELFRQLYPRFDELKAARNPSAGCEPPSAS